MQEVVRDGVKGFGEIDEKQVGLFPLRQPRGKKFIHVQQVVNNVAPGKTRSLEGVYNLRERVL